MADGQPSVAPKTTEEQDRVTYGQRRINIIWEVTQAVIALAVVGTAMFASAEIALIVTRPAADLNDKGMAVSNLAFVLLSNAVFLVIGFYFGRTNHQRIGGVGSHDDTR